MIKLSRLLAFAALAVLLSGGNAFTQQHATPEKEAFTPERFSALQEQGALVLLDVYADWCPTCAKQQEVLSKYRAENPDVPLHVLTIDFDDQKQYVKQFKAPRQSTLILYRGKERLWFSVAETSEKVIFEALDKAAAAPAR